MLTRSCWNILRELFSTYLTGYGLLYPVLDVNNCPPPPQKIFMGPELLSVDYRWSAPIWIPADSNAWGVADLKGTGINTIRIVLYHVKTGLPPSFRFILIPTVNKINPHYPIPKLACFPGLGVGIPPPHIFPSIKIPLRHRRRAFFLPFLLMNFHALSKMTRVLIPEPLSVAKANTCILFPSSPLIVPSKETTKWGESSVAFLPKSLPTLSLSASTQNPSFPREVVQRVHQITCFRPKLGPSCLTGQDLVTLQISSRFSSSPSPDTRYQIVY